MDIATGSTVSSSSEKVKNEGRAEAGRILTSEGFGGTKVDWGRAVTASLWATLALGVIGYLSMLPFDIPLKETSLIFKDWIVQSTPPPVGDAIGVIAINILWGFMLGFGYAFFYKGLPGKRLSKGITFGVCIWALGVLPYELLDVQVSRIPAGVVLILWIQLWLPLLIIVGLVVSHFYPRRTKTPGIEYTRSWSDLWSDVKKNYRTNAKAIGASFLMLIFMYGLFTVYITKPAEKAPWLFQQSLVDGNYTIPKILGIGAVILLMAFLFNAYYVLMRPGAPFGGVKGAVFFGLWLYGMTNLPFAIVFFPIFTVPTSVVLPTFTLLPLALHAGMGAINGAAYKWRPAEQKSSPQETSA